MSWVIQDVAEPFQRGWIWPLMHRTIAPAAPRPASATTTYPSTRFSARPSGVEVEIQHDAIDMRHALRKPRAHHPWRVRIAASCPPS